MSHDNLLPMELDTGRMSMDSGWPEPALHLSFPKCVPLERTGQPLDWKRHPAAMLFKYSLHTYKALPRPETVENCSKRKTTWRQRREGEKKKRKTFKHILEKCDNWIMQLFLLQTGSGAYSKEPEILDCGSQINAYQSSRACLETNGQKKALFRVDSQFKHV